MSDYNQNQPQNTPYNGNPQNATSQSKLPQQNQWQSPPQPPLYSPPRYQPQAGMEPPPGYLQKNRVAAGLLAMTMGAFGLHSFYLGNSSKGLIQLLVTLLTFGVGAFIIQIVSVIEGVKILDGRINTDAYGIYLK